MSMQLCMCTAVEGDACNSSDAARMHLFQQTAQSWKDLTASPPCNLGGTAGRPAVYFKTYLDYDLPEMHCGLLADKVDMGNSG